MNPLKTLRGEGQSIWLDYIRRSLMTSGELNRLIEEDGLCGMTSNPTIFEKAINAGADYDETLRSILARDPHIDIKTLYETIAIQDIQMAADVLRPMYDDTHGADGFVSLEVSPTLANDAEGTIKEAKRLWEAVDRPNLMVKVPSTPAGVGAFEELTAAGLNINCTLMFSLDHYENIAQAYIRGLKRCDDPTRVASVASFFVSRVDGAVDKALQANGTAEAVELRGRIAVANSKLAYKRFTEIFNGEDFKELRRNGARPQRPLWASTSTKNPDYRDVLYVEELIGPDTVNTLPPATLEAFRDHGQVARTVDRDIGAAEEQIEALGRLGIDLTEITEQLQVDGVAAFAKSFEELLEALKKKRRTILSSRAEHQSLTLGTVADRVDARLDEWDRTEFTERLWAGDYRLWSPEPQPEIEDRLGWLTLPRDMQGQLDAITAFAKEIRREGVDDVVLLGMGGSSLAPEVFQRTFGSRRGHPESRVLDSTHPPAVRALSRSIDLARTLFVVSSKSGTTTETLSFFKYFWHELADAGIEPGPHFIAITDPRTPLETLARERGFRRVFSAPPEVGGRYSALSVFGLVPAALIGVDIHRVIDGAWAMIETTSTRVSIEDNPALALGAAIGECAVAGRNKLTIVTSPSLAALPAWIEQLIAESTGKQGKGIVPVVDESLGDSDVYGDDRFFVVVSTYGEAARAGRAVMRLERAGFNVAQIQIEDAYLLGQEFFRWEVATAAAGSVLGINAFNQPDVQLAKKLAKDAMASGGSGSSWDDGVETLDPDQPDADQRFESFVSSAGRGDYVALQAFVPPNERSAAALQELRIALRDRLHVATTLGFGPRFLHSTGQLHKGGANNGLFVQIVDGASERVVVPETDYTFGDLIRAQARGDATALLQKERRIVRVRLGRSGLDGVLAMLEALRR